MLFNRIVRHKISPLIEQWQRICILAERIIKRREAAAVRIPAALRPNYLPTHFALPPFLPSRSSSTNPETNSTTSLTPSWYSLFNTNVHFDYLNAQADLSRLTNVLRALLEVNDQCWRGDGCELCDGVRTGLGKVATHTQRHSDLVDQRVCAV
jgi:sorting nexin-8